MRTLIIAASVLLCAGAAFAQPVQQGQGAPRPGVVATVTCRVGDIAVFQDRVHVRCAGDNRAALMTTLRDQMLQAQGAAAASQAAAAAETLAYFAVSTQSEPSLASLALSLATQASAQNKQVQIFFDASPGGNPRSCHPSDCRHLVGILMVVQN